MEEDGGFRPGRIIPLLQKGRSGEIEVISWISTQKKIYLQQITCLRSRYLVEKKEVNLNVRDVWDSTPLYYACLCGHHELVKYLLSEGARCDASTFDGERCIYGCLNREIKATLEQFRVITSKVRRREPFQEFMRKYVNITVFPPTLWWRGDLTSYFYLLQTSGRRSWEWRYFRSARRGIQVPQMHFICKMQVL